ncbi:MAG: DUF4352 domain-containing protein, partial [Actinoplanes sp.]
MSYPPQPQGQPYPQQPYGAPPPGYPAQAPPAKKRRWPWIVGGLALLSILGCVGLFTLVLGGTGAALNEMDENTKGKNAIAGQMGKAATDGKFQFTVTGMKCGVKQVGPAEFGEKAQGQFCLVDVTVKNTGASAEVFSDMSQQAYDEAGTEYSVDSGAGTWANKDYSTFLESINPGNSVKGKLV